MIVKYKYGVQVVGNSNEHRADWKYNGRVGTMTVDYSDHAKITYSDGDYWWYKYTELNYAKNKIVQDIIKDL